MYQQLILCSLHVVFFVLFCFVFLLLFFFVVVVVFFYCLQTDQLQISCFKQNMLENEAKCNNATFGTKHLLFSKCFIAY